MAVATSVLIGLAIGAAAATTASTLANRGGGQAPAAPPAPPTPTLQQTQQTATADRDRTRRQLAAQRNTSILTTPRGLGEIAPANTRRSTLLGY